MKCPKCSREMGSFILGNKETVVCLDCKLTGFKERDGWRWIKLEKVKEEVR